MSGTPESIAVRTIQYMMDNDLIPERTEVAMSTFCISVWTFSVNSK